MAHVAVTAHLREHLPNGPVDVPGSDVDDILRGLFALSPALRGYLLDDQGVVRRHVAIFVDGQPILDRQGLHDPVNGNSEVFVMQALSGG
jgi:molybdopterin synthase sulfur carrier subunit